MPKLPAWVYFFQNSRNWIDQGSRPGPWQFSLLIAVDFPTIPPPTTASPFRRDRFVTLHHRRRLAASIPPGGLRRPLGPLRADKGSYIPSRLPDRLGRIEFTYALRTGHSPPVALHPPLRERSYPRLQAGNVDLEGTYTLQIKRLHRRTSRHAPHDGASCVAQTERLGEGTQCLPGPASRELAARCAPPSHS